MDGSDAVGMVAVGAVVTVGTAGVQAERRMDRMIDMIRHSWVIFFMEARFLR